jgi:hypothetical protein
MSGRIDVWIPIGADVNRSMIAGAVARSITAMCFNSNVPICKRHRWRGLYPGLSMFILMEGLFGIGSELFRRFQNKVKSVTTSSGSSASSGSNAIDGSLALVAVPLDEHGNPNQSVPHAVDVATDFDGSRQKGAAWISSKPLGRVKVCRMAIEPMRQYQIARAALASKAQERLSTFLDVNALRNNPSKLVDTLPFYSAISGKLEDDSITKLSMLLNAPDLWEDLILACEKSLKIQSLLSGCW